MASVLTTAAKHAHAVATALLSNAPVTPGGAIPDITLKEENPEAGSVNLKSLPGKIIIIGVPGAFTPPCSSQVPGYITSYDAFKAKGVNGIYIVAVNDAFVTQAWKKKLAPEGTEVRVLADDQAEFIGQLGLLFNGTDLLGGPRSKRFAIVADNGVVSTIAVEDEVSDVKKTAAETILAQL